MRSLPTNHAAEPSPAAAPAPRFPKGSPAGPRSGVTGVGTAALGFFVLAFTTGVVAFLRGGALAEELTLQPTEFNHRIHTVDEGLQCSVCHPFFATEARSGLPSAATCALCHSEAQGESPEELRLVELLERGAALEWKPLFLQPPHVFYSHRRHVAVAGLECSTCHGAIGESERPPRRVAPLAMNACIECHERSQASTDCTACHR